MKKSKKFLVYFTIFFENQPPKDPHFYASTKREATNKIKSMIEKSDLLRKRIQSSHKGGKYYILGDIFCINTATLWVGKYFEGDFNFFTCIENTHRTEFLALYWKEVSTDLTMRLMRKAMFKDFSSWHYELGKLYDDIVKQDPARLNLIQLLCKK